MSAAPRTRIARRRDGKLLVTAERTDGHLSQRVIIAVGVLTMAYNGILAALLSVGFPIGGAIPAIAESTFLLTAITIVMKEGLLRSSMFPLSLSFFVMVTALILSIEGESLYLVSTRNFLIVSLFTLLGGTCKLQTLRTMFWWCSIIALSVLIFEVSFLDSYVNVFQPAEYLASTRGMSQSEYSGGLSAGTILFEGRFSLGLYSGPRTSSIFLEQVSINCFAIVIGVYLLTFFPDLSKKEIALHAFTIFAILATNNARMALILSVIFLFGYPIFSVMPRYLNLFAVPAIIGGLFTVFIFVPPGGGDDMLGRMATSYRLLSDMSVRELLLGSFAQTSRSLDSGYAFLIFSTTIFGLIFYWLYISFVVPQVGARSKRCAWGLTIYISVWLLVGGTGTFSMKTAPLLWLVVGFVRRSSLALIEESKPTKRDR